MRIGLTTFFKGSAFGGALPQVALYMAKGLKAAGHEVELIIPADSADWFTDCRALQAGYCVKRMVDGVQLQTYNLIIEVVWFLPVGMRSQLAQKTVMFYHYPPVFYDIESSVYPVATQTRNFEGLAAIWTWSHFAATDFAYLELLTRLPVATVPFVWDPCLLDAYCLEASVPAVGPVRDPIAVVCESNESNTSHCILPLTIISEIYKAAADSGKPAQRWVVLNSETVATRPYFKQNIVGNLHMTDCSGNFLKRLRLPDLCRESNILVTHQRFRPLKYTLLDALHLGLPLIHNCDLLVGIPGAEEHYTLNRIGQAIECWNRIVATGGSHSSSRRLAETRAALVARWGCDVFGKGVGTAINKTFTVRRVAPVSVPVAPVSVPVAPASVSVAPVSVPVAPALRIAFFDMWIQFVPQHNLLLAAATAVGTGSVVLDQNNPNLIVFGPFGRENERERWASIPKVFYTGENLPPLVRKDIVLNIGFKRATAAAAGDYFRFPNWMLELNWFNQDRSAICNPEPFDLKALEVTSVGQPRSKFCAFVASNPNCVQRNTAFHTLSRYKTVDSAGSLFNNCTRIAAGPGGSGGQTAKVEFYKQYKFALVCENSSDPGYVTEKIVHARLAGCVPIYWGDTALGEEFNTAGVIQIANFKTADELLAVVRRIDESPAEWSAMAGQPLFNVGGLERCRSLLRELGERLIRASSLEISKPKMGIERIPATASTASTASTAPTEATVPVQPIKQLQPVNIQIGDMGNYRHLYVGDVPGGKAIITCCNKNYMEAAVRLIKSTDLPVFVWIWDMTDEHVRVLVAAEPAAIIPFDMNWNPEWRDFWNPLHYAWKTLLWVLASATFTKGTQLLYLDSGVSVSSSLDKVWSTVADTGIFVVEMPEHNMRTWSHATFCQLMNMTPEELDAPQYSSNIVGFEAGGRWSRLFEDCFIAGCRKEIVVGYKWFQYSPYCLGHRHDQSIISLLGRRAGVKPDLLYKYISHTSLHDARYRGFPFYVHRRFWKQFRPVADGIDEAFIINLAHRKDRMERFWGSHPYMKEHCYREEAVYGNELKMTQELAQLFRDNDFKWKKGVMGVALSHYNLWKRLVADQYVSSYLVLEDDAVLGSGFLDKWGEIASLVPSDTDLVFLGGVLPPNRAVLPMVTEPVNAAFARIKQHNFFGGSPKRYLHFCAYSYIITKRGAAKLCELIAQRGIFTSIDHMMVNHGDSLLNIYFTTPLLAGCYQDEDPVYQKANFNDFNRVDTFDSDIWNNKECFTAAEVAAAPVAAATAPVAAATAPVAVATAPVAAVAAPTTITMVYFESHQQDQAIDSEWIEEIFQRKLNWVYAAEPLPSDSTVLLYYQHTTPAALIEGWINRHMDRPIHLYHASDERCSAPITLYGHPGIKTVFRNYWRPDCVGPKVVHLPLGYLNGKGRKTGVTCEVLSKRKKTWSFAGAIDRPERGPTLEALKAAVPNNLIHITPTFNSPKNLDTSTYTGMIQQSQFVPCLNGFWNVECYRFYEAIENGAIPLTVADNLDSYKNLFACSVNPPLLTLDSWKAAGQLMTTLSSQTVLLDRLQTDIWQWWCGYKKYLQTVVAARLA
jgi:GR25 family glycosyltransferase involved in LPS biosynthesis